MSELGITPSQTVGPYLRMALDWPTGPNVVPDGTPGALVITGCLYDGDGASVPDGLIETWQADAAGRFNHPDDPRGPVEPTPAGFRGFGRCPTDADGCYRIVTVKPGWLPAPGGRKQAPHLDVSVFARGLLDRVVTRIYFPDEPDANATDPVLSAIDDGRLRSTLVATRDGGQDGVLRFDIHLQGAHETAFFDV